MMFGLELEWVRTVVEKSLGMSSALSNLLEHVEREEC